MVKIFNSQSGFSDTAIYLSGGIRTKPWDIQIISYSNTNSAICLIVAALPYILTPLLSTVSKEKLVDNSKGLALWPESYCNKGGELAVFRAKWALIRKKLL